MKKTITQSICMALFLGSLAMTGCDSNTGVVETPEVTAEDAAKIEASQAEYQKSMQESYGKGN